MFRSMAYLDIPGGGQITAEGNLAFVGHMKPPYGTSIIDIADQARPTLVAQLSVPGHTHSHKVRVGNGLMVVNREAFPRRTIQDGFRPGFEVFDISEPSRPTSLGFHQTSGIGAHRFDFDGRLLYLSTEMAGFKGAITVIYDLIDPRHPVEVSRWWLPGQWFAGGETPTWPDVAHRTHHPLRFGDLLHIGLCHGGVALVDITDLQRPMLLARLPSLHGYSTHTVLPYSPAADPQRSFLVMVDEGYDEPGGVWIMDRSDPAHMTLASEFLLPFPPQGGIFGAHQPHEAVLEGVLFVAWFGHGLRAIDIRDPYHPREIGTFTPRSNSPEGLMTNDVFIDWPRRLMFVLDRVRGLEVVAIDLP